MLRSSRARRFVLGSAAALALVASACASSGDDDASSSSEAQTERRSDLGPRRFRDDFAAYLLARGGSEDDVRKLVYLAPPAVESPHVQPDPSAPLAPFDRFFAGVHPSALYESGVRTPLSPVADIASTFAKSGPIHVVLVPGIFGEFIDDRPFEELLASDTSAGRAFRAKVASSGAKVPVYHLGELRSSEVSIGDAVQVASVDDARGEPLVTLTFLRPATGSLETLGTLEESTATYLARLDAYFGLVGPTDNVYLMGYSRGAPVALDVVAAAARQRAAHPWIDRVDGVISLAGVLYGTPLADATKQPGNAAGDVLRELDDLAKHLHSCDPSLGPAAGLAHRTENTARWSGTAAKIAWILAHAPSHPEIALEHIDTATPDVGRLAKMLARIAFDQAFDLDRPLADYCGNVERFKKMVRATLDGVDSLTTESRLAWWRTHEVPERMRLFAITGTMGDATKGAPWPIATNPVAYDARSVDFKSLRTNFYDLYDESGLDLNDSQVTLPRARFWPSIHAGLNPRQAPLRAYFMGTLGEHHWGLAFPRAFPSNDGLRGDPFPRTVLLETIGTFVSQAIVAERHE